MKPALLAAIFCSITSICHAGSVFLNAESCDQFQANDVVGCFINKTGGNLNNIALKGIYYFQRWYGN